MLNNIEIWRLRGPFHVFQLSFVLFIPIFNNMGSLDQSIIILEDAVTFRKQSLAHWMHLVTQNVQVIFAVDPTMQGNTWTKRSPGYGCPNHY